MLISTNLFIFQEQMSNVEKKGTEELISKDNEGLGWYCHIWAEFYEENAVYNFFYSEIAQIRNEELYK